MVDTNSAGNPCVIDRGHIATARATAFLALALAMRLS
ncbi:hypothetical protein JOD67_003782 [Tenggerimyces flavus]|nr:hypothetical protein [Tenggerimyces flavus]